MLAWRRAGQREQLTTPAALRGDVIINDKHLHTYQEREDIDRILAIVLAGDAALAQRWIPKASAGGGPFDVRVLVIDGVIAQRVGRVGRGCLGIDVLVDPRGRPFVIECNAWGDFLPGLLLAGQDSYDLQLRGLLQETS